MADRKKFVKTLRVPKIKIAKITDPVLDKKKVTVKKLHKYVETLLAVFAPYMLPEALNTLREAMAGGDVRAAEHTLKAFNILPTAGGIQINQQNNNNNNSPEQPPPHRSLEAFLRDRAISRGTVIDAKVIECPPSSLPSSPQPAVGSETPASQS